MYCPNCHYEYQAWATTCADCGAALQPGAPPAPAAREPAGGDDGQFRDWVILTNVPNTFLGNLLKAQLEDAGVPVLMKRSVGADIGEWSHNDFVMHDLYVPLRYARRARRLIDSPPTVAPGGSGDPAGAWDEDEFADDDLLGDDLAPGASGPAGPSGWYLVDSGAPAPPAPATAPGAPAPAPALPSLGSYQQALDERKHHRAAGPAKVVPFRRRVTPAEAVDAADEGDTAADAPPVLSAWTRSRIYRVLMGLLLLAWTLPFLIQIFQSFGSFWDRLFP